MKRVDLAQKNCVCDVITLVIYLHCDVIKANLVCLLFLRRPTFIFLSPINIDVIKLRRPLVVCLPGPSNKYTWLGRGISCIGLKCNVDKGCIPCQKCL